MNIDFIIVGQGISGTMLSRHLLQAGRNVLVIDEARPTTASKIASGVINPVTGKKFVTTWMAAAQLESAIPAYTQLGSALGATFIRQCDVLNFHPTSDAATLFEMREQADDTYLHHINTPGDHTDHFNFHYGIGAVAPCYLVDVPLLLHHWRQHLAARQALLEERFDPDACAITADKISYRDITATKIIFCQGAADIDNPYFTKLNFQLNKGEVLLAQIPQLPTDHIYKYGPISIVPWQEEGNIFWIGSTFDREYTNELPTAAFRNMAETTLNTWLKLPYTIIGHKAALRPATGGQKPFIGLHPVHAAVGIFNGMGSKGCSLAPYFAAQFTNHLLHGSPLTPDVSIERFARILSR